MIQNREKRKRKNRIALIMTMAFLIAVFAGAKLFSAFTQPYNLGEEEIEAKKPAKNKPVVILLAGVDQRRGDRGRSDTLLLGFINRDKDSIDLVSIPRDSYVNIPGRGTDKINHAHAFGGMGLTIKTIEELVDVPVNYYVKTNLEGFKEIIDILDGIELTVEKEIVFKEEKTIVLEKGRQTLQGDEALAYVRFRGDAKGDFGRMERQQNFLKAIVKKGMQPSSIVKVPRLIPEFKNAVETNMSINEILGLSGILKNMNDNSLASYSLEGKPFGKNGVSYVRIDEKAKDEIISNLYK